MIPHNLFRDKQFKFVLTAARQPVHICTPAGGFLGHINRPDRKDFGPGTLSTACQQPVNNLHTRLFAAGQLGMDRVNLLPKRGLLR